ncbi:G-protein-signaling modulator 2 [Tyrophagus putrescentiae]|nr:G-protein-signaling modulator 2 [Tyrophagus putrescentiae]
MDSVSCLELALEGERLCKIGDFSGGVAFFEAAVKCGTSDMKTLSAIYSQLGNAYFYLGNYPKAMEYHKLDLTVAKSISDRIGEAKASGNLGNTLKMMDQYDGATTYCKRHLEISRELNDKVGEGRALYNLGNVYHTKAKNLGHLGSHDPGNYPDDVKSCLETAINYYKENLELMIKLGDRSAQGRTYGNLGNTHYLLGNFTQAVRYHEERLKIAIEFNDKAAERRAQCNLGNAHIFLGEFEKAVENYKQTLILGEELKDQVIEAQACYSLGNTYTLLRDFKLAIEYYLRHLVIAQKLNDRIGEGRAYWSLGNAMQAVGEHQKAIDYVQKHLDISKEIGDITGQENAQISISELRQILNQESTVNDRVKNIMRPKRVSMNKMELVPITPDAKKATMIEVLNKGVGNKNEKTTKARAASVECISKSHEDFFDLVSKFQSKRMDDQRCSIDVPGNSSSNNNNKENNHSKLIAAKNMSLDIGGHCSQKGSAPIASKVVSGKAIAEVAVGGNGGGGGEDLFDLIVGMQERRMDDQRATLPQPPNLNGFPFKENKENVTRHVTTTSGGAGGGGGGKARAQRQYSLNSFSSPPPEEDFFDMIVKSQQNRLEDQRTEMPSTSTGPSCSGSSSLLHQVIHRPTSVSSTQSNSPTFAPTVPDEDFFSLLMRFQSNRIEDQRSSLPLGE